MMIDMLILLLVINATPPIMATGFARITRVPLDFDRRFPDGRPILGKNKTVGGFVSGVAAGGIAGLFLGFPLTLGLLAGLLGMLGDSLTSFFKRRFRLFEGADVPVFDQLLEGGLPIAMFAGYLEWSIAECGLLLAVFIILAWFASFIRKWLLTPRTADSVGLVRSTMGFRGWRSCHTALSPVARSLNFETVLYYRIFMKGVFKGLGIYQKGIANALQLKITRLSLDFPALPAEFNSYCILFISDLHIDGLEGLAERLIEAVTPLKPDICLLGGDYRMEMYGSFFKAMQKLRQVVRAIDASDGIFGILGNHDCIEITPDLEDCGIVMLINDAVSVRRGGQTLSIAGVDDPHYYQCHDLEKAYREVASHDFSILLAHSPEIIYSMNGQQIDLCLCGHTHGGQICLPLIGPVFTHCHTPRRYISGLWRYGNTVGFTSRGAGSSGLPVRFNCPPEIVVLTLNRSTPCPEA